MGEGVTPPTGLPAAVVVAAATAAERLREGMPSSTRERWLPTSRGVVRPRWLPASSAESWPCSAAAAAARSACPKSGVGEAALSSQTSGGGHQPIHRAVRAPS